MMFSCNLVYKMLRFWSYICTPQDVKNRGNAMSSGKNKTARQSRIKTLVEKWRTDFIEYSSSELQEIQEVIEYILDERFYSKGR